MAKKSLLISDQDKFGGDNSIMAKVATSGKGKAAKEPKHAPTVDLTGPQVSAWGLDGATVGQKFCVQVHGVVKAASSGDKYGDDVPGDNAKTSVTVTLTHADPDCSGPEDEGDDDAGGDGSNSEDEGDTPSDDTGGAAQGDDNGGAAEDEDSSPRQPAKDTLSPKDAGLDEEDEE